MTGPCSSLPCAFLFGGADQSRLSLTCYLMEKRISMGLLLEQWSSCPLNHDCQTNPFVYDYPPPAACCLMCVECRSTLRLIGRWWRETGVVGLILFHDFKETPQVNPTSHDASMTLSIVVGIHSSKEPPVCVHQHVAFDIAAHGPESPASPHVWRGTTL